MSKVKYKFNTKSLTYEKVKVTFKQRLLQVLSYLGIGLVFATVTMLIAYRFIDSPKEKQLRRIRSNQNSVLSRICMILKELLLVFEIDN